MIALISLSIALLISFGIILYQANIKICLNNKIKEIKQELEYKKTSTHVDYYFIMGEAAYGISNNNIIGFTIDKIVKENAGVYIYGKDITTPTRSWRSKVDSTYPTIEEARVALDRVLDYNSKKLLEINNKIITNK